MIEYKHTITFPENFDQSLLETDDEFKKIMTVQDLLRQEASNRECIFFKDLGTEEHTVTIHFIWPSKEEADNFVNWANETHNYDNVYLKFVDKIKSIGGVISREELILE